MLYQLSYTHQKLIRFSEAGTVARQEGLEPPTTGLEGRCSIQLSYGRLASEKNLSGRGSRIRTCDPLLPKQMRYQTAPCPDGTRMLNTLASGCYYKAAARTNSPGPRLLFKQRTSGNPQNRLRPYPAI